VNDKFSLTIVQEGDTKLIVPADHQSSGPASSNMPVFYNPQMEFSRDMSVAIMSNLLDDGDSFLDGLAAAGSRGIRIAKECGKKIELHLNDTNTLSVEISRRNLDLNGISRTSISNKDLRLLLSEGSYDCVDIDPFGTPAPFFPMAIKAVNKQGILCVTATDTGTISGIFPKACLRKYGTRASRTPFAHEIGVRNLVGFVAREAIKIRKGIRPIISYYSDHYVRTFVRILDDNKNFHEKIGYCYFDKENLDRKYSAEDGQNAIGPIWIVELSDSSFLRTMRIPSHLGTAERIVSLIQSLIVETRIQRPFFNIDEFARKAKINPPKMDALVERLNQAGTAARTHFGPKTFCTDLPIEDVIRSMTR